jgi:CubicO group peptidase (beta-lactamase class C family)
MKFLLKVKNYSLLIMALIVSALYWGSSHSALAGGFGRSSSQEPFFLFATGEGRDAVREAMAATGATAVSLALVDGDRFVWTEAFGVKDVVGGRPLAASEETMFGMGQASKLVAAIAVMRLVERRAIRLDDPVVRHLPAFRMRAPECQAITIRMLLSHASGLPGTDRRNLYTTVPFPGYPKQVLATLAGQRLKHPPGFLHARGNDGYTLLEELVGAVSGLGYGTFVQKEILDPLGMGHTRFGVAALPERDLSRAFRGGDRLPRECTNASAAAGLFSTPEDMARLITMVVNGGTVKDVHILDEASIQEMGRDQTRNSFNPVPSLLAAFGLGWDTVEQPALRAAGMRAWSIQGTTTQYGTAIIVVPAERMGVIVTGASGFTGVSAMAVAERVLLRKLVENKRILEMPRAPEAMPGQALPLDEGLPGVCGLYASCEAAYRAGPGSHHDTLRLEVFSPDDRTWRTLADQLKLRADGWFASDEAPETSFRFEPAGARQYLARRWTTRFTRVQEILAEKVQPRGKPDPAWTRLAGRAWVLANEHPSSLVPEPERRLELLILPGEGECLFVRGQGYYPVDASKGGPVATMMLQIPGSAENDLEDLRMVPMNGETWLQLGGRIYR